MYRTDFDTHHRIASSKPCSSELHTSIVDFSTHTPHLPLFYNKDHRSLQLQTDKGFAVSFLKDCASQSNLLRPAQTCQAIRRKLHQDWSRCQALSCWSLTELIIFNCTANRAYLLLLMLLLMMLLLLLLATPAATTTNATTTTTTTDTFTHCYYRYIVRYTRAHQARQAHDVAANERGVSTARG